MSRKKGIFLKETLGLPIKQCDFFSREVAINGPWFMDFSHCKEPSAITVASLIGRHCSINGYMRGLSVRATNHPAVYLSICLKVWAGGGIDSLWKSYT